MSLDASAIIPDKPPAATSTPQAGSSQWLRQQRHHVLNYLLGMFLAIALPAIAYTLAVTSQRGTLSFNGAYYLATYVVVLALFLLRRMPDGARVFATRAVIFGFSLLAMYSGWLASSGRGFLLCLILISSLLIDERISWMAAGLALLTFAGFGWAYATGLLPVPSFSTSNVATIFIEGFGFALAIGVVVSTQRFLGLAIREANRSGAEARHTQELLNQRAQQLESANTQLEQMGRMKDEFVSNVSHESRTPISSMILHHELLSIHPEKRELHLSTMRRETDRLAHIVDGLLMLSRLDQARVEYRPVLADLRAVAAIYVADRQAVAESRGIKLEFSAEPPLPRVMLDEVLICQALSVLLTNALSYTPSAGTVTVSTRWRTAGDRDWAGVSIRDSGPGIPESEVPMLFERFFRWAMGRASGSPGTGLGLAICREIVARHGGSLELTSNREGLGAEFTIWIPTGDGAPAVP